MYIHGKATPFQIIIDLKWVFAAIICALWSLRKRHRQQ